MTSKDQSSTDEFNFQEFNSTCRKCISLPSKDKSTNFDDGNPIACKEISSSQSFPSSSRNSRSGRSRNSQDAPSSKANECDLSWLSKKPVKPTNFPNPASDQAPYNPRWFEKLTSPPGSVPQSQPNWMRHEGENSALRSSQSNESFLCSESQGQVSPFMESRPKSSRENSARFGRRAEKRQSDSGKPEFEEKDKVCDIVVKEENKIMKAKGSSDKRLEAFWCSLNSFDKLHKGRLSTDSKLESDILDIYLQSNPKETHHREYKDNIEKPPSDINLLSDDTKLTDFNVDFIIPELPEGQLLTINVLTTWGDKHYLGLNGVEVFCDDGIPAVIEQIWADPANINILPEYERDPRVVKNLLDGVYRTRDDMHLWLAPFTPGLNHLISLRLKGRRKIAMIRIWNYNKSRIHSYRGARLIEMTFDSVSIFRGEIARACGEIQGGTEAFGDTILFTTSDSILESISHNDKSFDESLDFVNDSSLERSVNHERPPTGIIADTLNRPFTSAKVMAKKTQIDKNESYAENFIGQTLTLSIISNWGDTNAVGLTGLEIVGEEDNIFSIDENMIDGNFHSKSSIMNLFNGMNITTCAKYMWSHLSDSIQNLHFNINFGQQFSFKGIRVWNYNSSQEESYQGVKQLIIHLDGLLLSPLEGFLLRRAPGCCFFDYVQEIQFGMEVDLKTSYETKSLTLLERPIQTSSVSSALSDYEPPLMPSGFIFQFQLLSTWGDLYYVGLNGIEFYDPLGYKIAITENNIAAYPDSVNVLDKVSDDVRTPDKLIDGANDSKDPLHMWLAPILPGIVNRIYVVFDVPVLVAKVKIWNYGKTVSRGTKEFGVLVDDLLLFHGVIPKIDEKSKVVKPYVLSFQSDSLCAEALQRSPTNVSNSESSSKLKLKTTPADQALRPTTSVTAHARRRRRPNFKR